MDQTSNGVLVNRKARFRFGAATAGLGLALVLGFCVAVLPETGQGASTAWKSGDVIVADSIDKQIEAVDPTTGVATPVSSGLTFRFPADVVFDDNGDILVVDRDAYLGPGAIIRVNGSGTQTFLSSNEISAKAGGKELFRDPIAADRKGGSLYVADFGGKPKRVVKVDIATGKQSLVTKGDNLGGPFGIDVDGNRLLVADAGGKKTALGTRGGIVEVNPKTGKQEVVSSGGSFDGPGDVVAEDNKSLLVLDAGSFNLGGALFRVNRKTGAQKTVFKNGDVEFPQSIALSGSDEAYVSGALRPNVTNGQLFSVNLNTGDQSLINDTNLNNPLGIAVAP